MNSNNAHTVSSMIFFTYNKNKKKITAYSKCINIFPIYTYFYKLMRLVSVLYYLCKYLNIEVIGNEICIHILLIYDDNKIFNKQTIKIFQH